MEQWRDTRWPINVGGRSKLSPIYKGEQVFSILIFLLKFSVQMLYAHPPS